MEEIIEKISKKVLDELKKVKKPPYPLFYKEIFVTLAKEENILEQLNPKLLCIEPSVNEKLLDKTAEAVKNISESSNNIKKDSIKLMEEIKPVKGDELKKLVVKYSSKLLEEINRMQERIDSLEAELEEAYKELLIDPLTKAFNRKAFEKDIEEILKKGKTQTLNLAFAVLDLDHFKQINDTYGHLVGDFVLKKLVEIIKKILRKEDSIYRLGGDEFVIVMREINLNEAKKIIDKIIFIIKRTKLKYKDELIEITISVGLTMHEKGDTKESIIHRADLALYEAKKSRNRYVVKL